MHANNGTRWSIAGAALTAALGVGLLWATRTGHAQDSPSRNGQWTARRVAQTWNRTCTQCHTVPDTSFATDLAWLDQVNRTS